MKRLLCIVGGMNAGGAETFLMKVYRNLDKSKYQMDFCVSVSEKGFYDNEIKKLGGKIIHTTPKTKGMLKSFLSIKRIVKEGDYKYVMRVSQHSLSSLELLAAKLGGAKKLIYRSSNSGTGGGKIEEKLHYLFRFLANKIPSIKLAPSSEAAKFMFGKNCLIKNEAQLLHNGIDMHYFFYDESIRKETRKALDIENDFVVGHIGRFSKQKNHEFLIDIFREIYEKRKNSILLLIGIGELEMEIKEKVKRAGLQDRVHLLGVRSDIPKLLMAMDIFVFPSFYEGMPNTVIEAQATGLRCIISDAITLEANITGLVDYLPLGVEPIIWANKALEIDNTSRLEVQYKLIEKGYDIKNVVDNFTKIIFEN